jgi:hypothetical protein
MSTKQQDPKDPTDPTDNKEKPHLYTKRNADAMDDEPQQNDPVPKWLKEIRGTLIPHFCNVEKVVS